MIFLFNSLDFFDFGQCFQDAIMFMFLHLADAFIQSDLQMRI